MSTTHVCARMDSSEMPRTSAERNAKSLLIFGMAIVNAFQATIALILTQNAKKSPNVATMKHSSITNACAMKGMEDMEKIAENVETMKLFKMRNVSASLGTSESMVCASMSSFVEKTKKMSTMNVCAEMAM